MYGVTGEMGGGINEKIVNGNLDGWTVVGIDACVHG